MPAASGGKNCKAPPFNLHSHGLVCFSFEWVFKMSHFVFVNVIFQFQRLVLAILPSHSLLPGKQDTVQDAVWLA